MRVAFSLRALRDLDELFRYLDSQSPEGAPLGGN
jgi:plasmid stabilization system protein ParE